MAEQPPAAPFHQRTELERAKRGWTKDQLAERAGIGRRTYDRLATELRPPIPRTVKKLCQALDIDLAEGLRLAGITDPNDAGAEHQVSDDVSREERAQFAALRQTKTENLVEIITLLASQPPGGNSQEIETLADDLTVELLNPPRGMARGALHHATLDVILHLLGKLAEARGETVAKAWEQEAADLTRGAGHG